MNKFVLVSLFFFLTLAPFKDVHSNAKVFDGIIAVVDDDVILSSELERRMNLAKQQIEEKHAQLPPATVFKKQVMEQLISESLQLQLAQRMGVRISDAELNNTIQRIAANNNQTEAEFREQMQKEGGNYTLFREDLRHEIMMNRVQQAQISRRINVSDQEVEDLMKLNEEQGATNSTYHVGHIMVAISETASKKEIEKAKEKAKKIVAELRNGADFTQTAIEKSDGRDALKGGDFGWRSLAELPTLFAGTVRNLNINDISDPLKSASGLHILKLLGKQGGEEAKMEEQVLCRHILIKPSKIISEEQAKQQLLDIIKALKEGKDFAEFAKLHSEDLGSASEGGKIDWAAPNVFAPEFRDQVETLKMNEISKPFKTQFGWHIVELLGKRTADKTAEDKSNKARRTLFNRKFAEESNLWLNELRSKAVVKIFDIDESIK